MRVATTGLVLFATATLLSAQQGVSRPYQEGEVQSFLERARENRRPALVLFNFNLDSG